VLAASDFWKPGLSLWCAESGSGTYATFPDGRRKAGISQRPDVAGLLSMLVYEFTP
jgi:hypothetical protein